MLILNEKNEVLLMQRGKHARNEVGWWSKPGGSVTFGENMIDAMKREVKEELDIVIDIWGYLPHTDHIISKEKQHWVAGNFIARICGGEPKNMEPDKCVQIGWFALDALPKKSTQTTRDPIADFLRGRFIVLTQKYGNGIVSYYNAIQKFQMQGTNNEDMGCRRNVMIEELGKLAQAMSKGKSRQNLIEENIDLLNLVVGNFISLGVSAQEIDDAFWAKYQVIMDRKKKKLDNGTIG